ncbi:phosphatidylserine/phosphatidylglycerophosphate/cardiolipin synthase-like enzyme [Bacillus fengqiuensis]|nr:phosphatidylserine/phosphatidylglycerophosphate/cardiolipin synthase-like enzyme [Bacillus fengqiuensis]
MDIIKRLFQKKRFIIIIALIFSLSLTIIYHSYKPLPQGTSYEGDIHRVENIQFLYDLTYQKGQRKIHERMIFGQISKAIEEADKFIVLDMFLFNSYTDSGTAYPPITAQLTEQIIKKKRQNPSMPIVFLTDEINTTYGSHSTKELNKLKQNGIEIVITNLEKLRDSNPLYSSVWRLFFQWFGQAGDGWIPNPMAKEAPKVTARSYLKLLNVKANHRKVIATDKTTIISSANPHDESGFHSNVAFQVNGNIIRDVLESEQAVADFSEGTELPSYKAGAKEQGNISVQLLTERKILKHILQTLQQARAGDQIWIAMFYLADRQIINGLVEASKKGADIRLILDPNANAFGREKIGLPNRPVAAELVEDSGKRIAIRWYNTHKEQFHPKMMMLVGKRETTIISGSANFTERNLDNYNLETNLKITAPNQAQVSQDVLHYFMRLWNNTDGIFTLPLRSYEDETTPSKRVLYAFQKLFKFTTY